MDDVTASFGSIDSTNAMQDVGRLLSHLPDGASPLDALGPASHWIMDDDAIAAPPKGLDDVFAKIRRDIPWEPLAVPEGPEGPESLMTALGEYADAAGVELPDAASLRAQVASLRLQPEAEEGLSQLVRAYNEALLLEAEATKDLTEKELRLVARDGETVQQWFDADADRTDADLEGLVASLTMKVDMADRLQAADLLLRTSEAVKDAVSLPPVPIAPDVASVAPGAEATQEIQMSEWPGRGDPWDRLHQVVSLSTMQVPAELPEPPVVDVHTALAFHAAVLGIPVAEVITAENLQVIQTLPPSLSDAVARIVTARALGLLSGDPVLHSRLVLDAVQEAEPVLEAWAAVHDLHRNMDSHAASLDAAAILETVLVPGPAGPFAAASGRSSDAAVPEPPGLAKLLRGEGLDPSEAKSAVRGLPAPVALGAAYALHGIQQVEAARDEAFAVLPPAERAAIEDTRRVAELFQSGGWDADDAALVKTWTHGMTLIGPTGLQALDDVQADALASIEAGAALLGTYADSMVPTDTTEEPLAPSDGDGSEDGTDGGWAERAWGYVKDFQVIGTASAQTLPSTVTTCRDTAFSDCDQDVWFEAGGVLITGFEGTTIGIGVTSSTPALAIDLGGDDTYRFPVATAPGTGTDGARVAIDAGGDDTYDSNGPLGQGAADGLGTLAVLWDHDGEDTYIHDCTAQTCGAQGYGANGGVGVLYDGGGPDTYEASRSRAHGVGWGMAGLGGTGVLLDRDGGDDSLRASRGQGYAEGTSSTGILINDGNGAANSYWTANSLNPRYQGGRAQGDAATGVLLDLGGLGTSYSNVQVPEGGDWTYISHEDDAAQGQRMRKDDALWMERSSTSGPGLGIDTRRGNDDNDPFDNWVELLAGSDPQDGDSQPQDDVDLGDLIATVLGLVPDDELPSQDDIEEMLPDPDDLPDEQDIMDLTDPENLDPQTAEEAAGDALSLLDGMAQNVDAGLCAVPFDEAGGCALPMHLLHIGPSTDDSIDAPALILIEMGGDDTYTVETAGPGAFYRRDPAGGAPYHVSGVGSIAIDLFGHDEYQDPGGPTQGAVDLSTDMPVPDELVIPPSGEEPEGLDPFGQTSIIGAYNHEETCGDYQLPIPSPLISLDPAHYLESIPLESILCNIQALVTWIGWQADQASIDRVDPHGLGDNPYLSPTSLLIDRRGDDSYAAGTKSQGSAYSPTCSYHAGGTGDLLTPTNVPQFEGGAWLMDLDGADSYDAGASSQGYVRNGGGRAGLVDLAGDDTYRFVTQGRSVLSSPITKVVGFDGPCFVNPYPVAFAVLYDGAGQDIYDNSGDDAAPVDERELDFSKPGDHSDNDEAFASQGRGSGFGNFIGAFMDEGADQDTYLVRGNDGVFDLSAIKNDVFRTASGTGILSGGKVFSDAFLAAQTAAVGDPDGDGAPSIVEEFMLTDPEDGDDHPGTVWDPDGGNSTHPLVRMDSGSRGGGGVNGVYVNGLLIGGHQDAVYADSQPFMVVLGGNNTYTHPRVGGMVFGERSGSTSLLSLDRVTFFLEAGPGDSTYIPTCEWIQYIGADELNEDVGGGGTYRPCLSLGAASNSVAVMVDGGGNNTFHTQNTLRVRSSNDWAPQLVTQGAGINGGVGALVTINATDRFIAELTVQVLTTRSQGSSFNHPSVSASGVSQGAGIGSGVGVLASLGRGDDQYVSRVEATVEVEATDGYSNPKHPPAVADVAQGGASNAFGLLFDGGGNNTFSASSRLAQGAAQSTPSGNSMGILWSGDGNDHYTAGGTSQGAAGTPPVADLVVIFNLATEVNVPSAVGVLLDAGGQDTYTLSPAGAAAPDHGQGSGAFMGVGTLLDMAGDDRYLAPESRHVQGSGVEGTGVLLDLGGNDHYLADDAAQAHATDDDGFELSGFVPTWGLLVDLHGQDVYQTEGNGQGLVHIDRPLVNPEGAGLDPGIGLISISPTYSFGGGSSEVYKALLVDGAGDDRYASGSSKHLRHDLCEEGGTCLSDNEWIWDSRPGTDVDSVFTSLDENRTLFINAIGKAGNDAQGASQLVDDAANTVETIQQDATDGDEAEAITEEILGIVTDTQAYVDGMVEWVGVAETAADQSVADALALLQAIRDADVVDEDGLDDESLDPVDEGNITDLLDNASAVATDFLANVTALHDNATELQEVYTQSTENHTDESVSIAQQQLGEIIDNLSHIITQTNNSVFALALPLAESTNTVAENMVDETTYLARFSGGIDASHLEDAISQLYETTEIQMLPLQVWADDGPVHEGDTTQESLHIQVRVHSAHIERDRVDRVAISADNLRAHSHVIGYATFDPTSSDNDTWVYRYTWNTSTADLPERFLDGDYTLRASVFLDSGPSAGGAGAPDLPAAESDPFDLTIDNPPVALAAMEGSLVTSAGLPLTLHLGTDTGWPSDMDATEQVELCDDWNVDPCHPGADVTFTRTDIDDNAVMFDQRYLPAGTFVFPITATEGGQWDDGTYLIRLDARDLEGQTADGLQTPFFVIVDAFAPTSRITTPPLANFDHSSNFGGTLNLKWTFDDPDGSGVTGICVVPVDEQGQAMRLDEVCREGTALSNRQADYPAKTGDTLRFAIAAVDMAGNTDSLCTGDEETAGLAPPRCIASKVDPGGGSDPGIQTVTVDFDSPRIQNGDVHVDGSPPEDVYTRPGSPVNFTAVATDKGSGLSAPGTVQIQLPAFDADGFIVLGSPVAMKTNGDGIYWYDEWPLHNQDMHAFPRDDRLGFSITAIDQAGNRFKDDQAINVDSLPPNILPPETTYIQDPGTEQEKEFLTGKPNLLARVQARVNEASMDTMVLNVTDVMGADEEMECETEGSGGRSTLWTCEFLLPPGLADGDYAVRFNATDTAGNRNDDVETTIHIRAEKLSFSNITVGEVGHDRFLVNWTTPFDGTSQVRYGEDLQLSQETPVLEGYRDEHSVEVTGLKPSTPYFFHVVSANTAGVINNSTASSVPVVTDNAFSFGLTGITEGGPVRGEMAFGYDLRYKAGTDPVDVTLFVQEAGKDVDPFEVETFTLEEGQETLTLDTLQFADGLYSILMELDRGRGLDTMEVVSPVFRIDNTDPVIALVAPRPDAAIAHSRPVFEVQLQDLPLGQEPPLSQTLRLQVGGQTFMHPEVDIQSDDLNGLKRKVAFTLPVPLEQGRQQINVSVKDAAGNEAKAQWRFFVDSLPPERSEGGQINYLPGPDHAMPGGQAEVVVDLADTGSDVASVRLDLSGLSDDAEPVSMLGMAGGHWKATIDFPTDVPHGISNLSLVAKDSLGNEGPVGEVMVSVDAQPPQITDSTATNINHTSATIHVTTDETTKAWHGNGTVSSTDPEWATEHIVQVSDLDPGKTHAIIVHAVDKAGNNVTKAVAVETKEDSSPPSKVTHLEATSPSEGVVMLSWAAATDNAGVASYLVARADDPAGSATTVTERIHRDGSAPAGQEVTYSVAAVDVAGNVGPAAEVTIKPLALPHLSDALVTPMKGPSHEPFTFQVNYSHPIGLPADLVTVRVGGATHILERADSAGADCSVNCLYRLRARLPPATLFDGPPSGVVFTASTDGHKDTLSLDEGPLVLRGWKGDGVVDLTDSEAKGAPGFGSLATLLVLAAAAIAFSRRGRHRP